MVYKKILNSIIKILKFARCKKNTKDRKAGRFERKKIKLLCMKRRAAQTVGLQTPQLQKRVTKNILFLSKKINKNNVTRHINDRLSRYIILHN